MVFHWQSKTNVQNVGVDDMVLLSRLNNEAIVDNLRKRFMANNIFTNIGPVLIAVNPFKEVKDLFSEQTMEKYRGAAQYENLPHIYSIADEMFRNMLIDNEKQCVIISGESGAGKTVEAKHIMSYLCKIAGGGQRVKHIKDVILQSNPLLESFGNSATVRNWNSSRFGKYVEIMFSRGGEPIGGKISNFLLEKSRVVFQNQGERNFHIFYQLCCGADGDLRNNLGIGEMDYYNYLNRSGLYTIDGSSDVEAFKQTLHAMEVVGISSETQVEVLQLVAAILHIGNITFTERNNYAAIADEAFLEFPAFLLGISAEAIKEGLTRHAMESKWGDKLERIDMTLNVEQAEFTRDAWTKDLYARLFDYLIQSVNRKVELSSGAPNDPLSIGILDIYGFEIFDKNGFEQFCINYVNEKLQQIFIELTLKAEQEEYVKENIQWTPISYFNNKVVCDLIEAKRPPGIMCILDDTCSQIHGQNEGADDQFLLKMDRLLAGHEHYRKGAQSFVVRHYAGEVVYNIDGFCEKNRDVFYRDFIGLMRKSSRPFLVSLFPEPPAAGNKSKPTSFSLKIRVQANGLIDSLAHCAPHYVRCIKPNETKRAGDWDVDRVLHQVEYLGLKENIRVRRAGFAYRRPFEKFLYRYAILSRETWPQYNGDLRKGVEIICQTVSMDRDQYQLGRTKVFIKNPESVFLLEEMRERKYDDFARIIQKAFRKFSAAKRNARIKMEAADILYNKKERRRNSINRNFVGDYIGIEHRPGLKVLLNRRDRLVFAVTLTKYNRQFKPSKLDLLLTSKEILLVGRQKETKGRNKGKLIEIVKRRISFSEILSIGLSPYQDNFFVVNVCNSYSSFLECPLKTEFIILLNKQYKEFTKSDKLPIEFKETHEIILKKVRFAFGPLKRTVVFHCDDNETNVARMQLEAGGMVLHVYVGHGLPSNTKPSIQCFGPATSQRKYRQTSDRQAHRTAPQPRSQRTEYAIVPIALTHSSTNRVYPCDAIEQNKRVNQNYTQPFRTESLDNQLKRNPRPKPPLKPKPKRYVEALYQYDAQDTDELSMEVGDCIELLNKDASGWWQGRVGNRVGLFPGNYVKEL